MTGDTHYDLEILAELAEDLLDAATALRVREHLAVCDPCGERLADLAAVREVLAATPSVSMPIGVAKRIDMALAAERAPVGLLDVELLDPPPQLGVVSDDGTIVPARPSRRRARRWILPASAAAAAAAVIGSVALSSLATGGGSNVAATPLIATGEPTTPAALAYSLTESNWNYSNADLQRNLYGSLGPAPAAVGATERAEAARCVSAVLKRTGHQPFAIDRAFYNGSEALIMASWKDQVLGRVYVDVVDQTSCKALRKTSIATW
ncbi:anti-sigma factor family protein [Nonomuraea soli]|uniref:Zf-HC2 domain-containing protein n=1 Tax=Nonomuraea soli TaxID=1032476 RepID=A0A7W0CJ21_9ACTN|nr:zf-HC2 domain-containing protein [Nonomuraea soli]MBA2891830.1 hypothetical protein [Nonomuraea soli]